VLKNPFLIKKKVEGCERFIIKLNKSEEGKIVDNQLPSGPRR
jgi:hypothetical protein